jgi:hypothetical protein
LSRLQETQFCLQHLQLRHPAARLVLQSGSESLLCTFETRFGTGDWSPFLKS